MSIKLFTRAGMNYCYFEWHNNSNNMYNSYNYYNTVHLIFTFTF